MARKVKDVTVSAEGRDQGKVFRLTELPAVRAEKWATRALLAIGRSGVTVPEEALGAGMAAIAAIGIRAIMSVAFDEAEPLLDEIMGCVKILPDPKNRAIERDLFDEDIEEVATILMLRDEVMHLHMGFSIRETLSRLAASAKAPPDSENTPTSTGQSAPSSPPVSPPSPS